MNTRIFHRLVSNDPLFREIASFSLSIDDDPESWVSAEVYESQECEEWYLIVISGSHDEKNETYFLEHEALEAFTAQYENWLNAYPWDEVKASGLVVA